MPVNQDNYLLSVAISDAGTPPLSTTISREIKVNCEYASTKDVI